MRRGVQYRTIEAAGEFERIACLLELETEAAFATREKGDLEQGRLYPLVIEPGPHLGHDGGQVRITASNLDNVHKIIHRKCFSRRTT